MKNYIEIQNRKISTIPFFIIKNPCLDQYKYLLENLKSNKIIGIINKENGDFYVTDAYYFDYDSLLTFICNYYNINEFTILYYKHNIKNNKIEIENLNEIKKENRFQKIINGLANKLLQVYTMERDEDKEYELIKSLFVDYIVNENDEKVFFNEYPYITMLLEKYTIKENMNENSFEDFMKHIDELNIENLNNYKY